ncbi:hypothetical protein TRIP_B350449 [uncultured Desulfatiglans sp.]|nr:hypothetical protein TRIP_B350449 [uncultured Desulfatiglans sp.]
MIQIVLEKSLTEKSTIHWHGVPVSDSVLKDLPLTRWGKMLRC